MSWALRRRLIIIGLVAAVLAAGLTAFFFTTIHQAPSCTDQKQNQGEEGIDCGGPCSYLCSESQAAPSVRFVRPVSPSPGRTDVIAYVDNPNSGSAAKDVPFTIELYDSANVVIAKKDGTMDLPPSATVPVFVPNLFSGSQTVARAFLTFDIPEHLWYRYQDARIVPTVTDVQLADGDAPRVTAVAHNPSAQTLGTTAFIATIFDGEGNAMAASRTVAVSIPPQGTAPLVFTWPSPFPSAASRIEVVPVVPLPSAP